MTSRAAGMPESLTLLGALAAATATSNLATDAHRPATHPLHRDGALTRSRRPSDLDLHGHAAVGQRAQALRHRHVLRVL